ncbi:MAG: MerR family transcriptional regulator [Cytophagales bacterium]|nr:MAG: MerR family transcriptional regulator [Cytophagales bacterium]
MQSTGKLYYTITEVAEQFEINSSKLRFYEKEFPSLKPKKNRSGDRIYTQADIDHIREIFELVETKGLKLPAAREFLQTKDKRGREVQEHIKKLQGIKSFLASLRDDL